jgi:AAA+ ATPase superfamily predicted ATPase
LTCTSSLKSNDQYFSIEKEWKALTEEAQISLETDVGSIKDFTQYLQDKVELEGHICSTEPINLNVFLNNVVSG